MAEEERHRIITKREVTVTLPVVKAPKFMQGFIDFVREQGVVGLAVGLVLGVAAKSVVDSVVNNLFSPVIGLLTGGVNLGDKAVCLKTVGAVCKSNLRYGQVLSDILGFLIVASVVYFVVKGLKLDKLDKKKAE